jgi:predicted nucleotidyltransferase
VTSPGSWLPNWRDAPSALLDLAEVRLALSDLLGRDAGVVIREDLRPRFRDRIADDLVEVF